MENDAAKPTYTHLGRDLFRGLTIWSVFISVFAYQDKETCDGLNMFFYSFFFGQILFYFLYIGNQLLKLRLLLDASVVFHSTLVFVTTILTYVDYFRSNCSPKDSLKAILAVTFLVYGTLKFFGDIFYIFAIIKKTTREERTHLIRANITASVDLLSTSLSAIVMIIMLKIWEEGTCNEDCMKVVEYFYWCCIGALILLSVFVPASVCGMALSTTSRNSSAGYFNCALLALSCLMCVWGLLCLVIWVLVFVNYWSPNNDCRDNAIYVDFFMRFVVDASIILLIFAGIVVLLTKVDPTMGDPEKWAIPEETEEKPLNDGAPVENYTGEPGMSGNMNNTNTNPLNNSSMISNPNNRSNDSMQAGRRHNVNESLVSEDHNKDVWKRSTARKQ